jgi:MoaA/NifB/PqqE/SkfB family radical SAM enzyme
MCVIRLVPTHTFVALLQRLRKRWRRVRIAAVLAAPEGGKAVRAVASEIIYAPGRHLAAALWQVRAFAPDTVVLAGGTDYGFSPTYLKAVLLARLSGARCRLQWEPGDLGAGRPLAEWRRRIWRKAAGRVVKVLTPRARRRAYYRPPRRGPHIVQIGLSEACNYHCLMCPFHNPAVDREHREADLSRMSLDTFTQLIGELRQLGTQALDICGSGESLTNPAAMEMIALARESGFLVKLATNGALLTEASGHRLVDLGLDQMRVSVNAGSDDVYAQMHPGAAPGAMDRLLARLQEMAEYAEETGQRPITVEFSAVLTRVNRHEIPAMVEAAREARAASLMLIRMGPARGQDDLLPRPEDWEGIRAGIAEAKALAEGYGIPHNLDEWQFTASPEGTRSVYEDIPCYIGSRFALVLASGTVKFCCHCFPPVGELRDGGFTALWQSARYQHLREQALSLPHTKQALIECGCFHACSHVRENLAVHEGLYGPLWRSRTHLPREVRA